MISSIWATGINLNMVQWWNKFEKWYFKQGEIDFLTSDIQRIIKMPFNCDCEQHLVHNVSDIFTVNQLGN